MTSILDDRRAALQALAAAVAPSFAKEQLAQLCEDPAQLAVCAELALGHGLGSLLRRRLEDASVELPAEVTEPLDRAERSRVAQNLLLRDQLGSAMAALGGAGVDALVYKGPTLAQLAYGGSWSREYGDIDLLVREQQVREAFSALESAGFEPEFEPGEGQWRRVLRMTKELPLRGRGDSVLELHWSFVPRWFPGRLDLEPTFRTAVSLDIDGLEVRTPSVEETVLILCVHGMTHRWDSLRWLVDLAWLLDRSPDVDWDHLSQRAASFGGGRLLRVGLGLTARHFEVALPERFAPRSGAEVRIVDRLAGKLLTPDRGVAWLTGRLRVSLAMVERPAARLVALRRIFGLKKTDLLEYPRLSRLWPLYWVLRPFRLARHYLGEEMGRRSRTRRRAEPGDPR